MILFLRKVTCMWLIWICIGLVTDIANARRYRYCSEGCCPEEYCAFHTICYPKTHCLYGCPDGTCEKYTCIPPKPCTDNNECAVGNICTMHYNLGYTTCQYNLDIGKTLCSDRDGKSLKKPTK